MIFETIIWESQTSNKRTCLWMSLTWNPTYWCKGEFNVACFSLFVCLYTHHTLFDLFKNAKNTTCTQFRVNIK